jgi:hypothetical protein
MLFYGRRKLDTIVKGLHTKYAARIKALALLILVAIHQKEFCQAKQYSMFDTKGNLSVLWLPFHPSNQQP